jgi:hypothetical protein
MNGGLALAAPTSEGVSEEARAIKAAPAALAKIRETVSGAGRWRLGILGSPSGVFLVVGLAWMTCRQPRDFPAKQIKDNLSCF